MRPPFFAHGPQELPDIVLGALGPRMLLYLQLPNYTNNLLRLGFEQSDIGGGPGGGPSNRLVDAIVAWGTPEQIALCVPQHFDAGADHVAVQVLADSPDTTADGWRTMASALLD